MAIHPVGVTLIVEDQGDAFTFMGRLRAAGHQFTVLGTSDAFYITLIGPFDPAEAGRLAGGIKYQLQYPRMDR